MDTAKLEKIKSFNNDDSDLITKFVKYIEDKMDTSLIKLGENVLLNEKSMERVYPNFESFPIPMSLGKDTLYILFTDKELAMDNKYVIENYDVNKGLEFIDEAYYYSGSKYESKLEGITLSDELIDKIEECERVHIVFDMSSISSFPIWDTVMYRRMRAVIDQIEDIQLEELNPKMLHKIIKGAKGVKVYNKSLYDLDVVIHLLKEVGARKPIIDSYVLNDINAEEVFLADALMKLVYAVQLEEKERLSYIYDVSYKDMNNLFSKYGFCNFKDNKCFSQRHKNLFNRYPVPDTDGCCFNVFRKCKYNNKDGTCQVECLPCKLFTCPFLSRLEIGLRVSELILLRAFLTNRQRKVLIYKFFRGKEELMKRL